MAESGAFQLEETQFLGPVENPQVAVEFEAIDHRGRLRQQDVLRPQVAVRLDDAATCSATVEFHFETGEDRVLAPGQQRCAVVVERTQHEMVRVDLGMHALPEQAGLRDRGFCGGIERGEQVGHARQRRYAGVSALERGVQHPAAIDAPHLHEPVDGLAGAADRQAAGTVDDKLHGPQVDIRRQPAIQPHLRLGVGPACRKRAVVHRVPAHGLTQLECMLTDEKHPREVGLDGFVARAAEVAQVGDFVCEADRHEASIALRY